MSSYRERLRPSAATWLLVPIAALMAGAATYPLGAAIAVPVGLLAGAAVLVWLLRAPQEIRVTEEGLHAGKAYLEAEHIGEVEELDAAATRQARGPQLRADAWLLHSPWVRTAVRVQIDDEADATPYWVVSTRRPAELAAALLACRPDSGQDGQAAHSEQTG